MRALRACLKRYERTCERKNRVVFLFELGAPEERDKKRLRIGQPELEARRVAVRPCQHTSSICGDTVLSFNGIEIDGEACRFAFSVAFLLSTRW